MCEKVYFYIFLVSANWCIQMSMIHGWIKLREHIEKFPTYKTFNNTRPFVSKRIFFYSYIKILHSIQVFKNFFDDRKGRCFERNMLNCIFEKSAFDPFLQTISIFKWEMVTMRKIIKRLKVGGYSIIWSTEQYKFA